MKTNELTVKAEREIAAILAQLETDTNTIVEKVDINDFSVASISEGEQLLRHINIITKRLPGTRWAK